MPSKQYSDLSLQTPFKMLSSFNLLRRLLVHDFIHDPTVSGLGRTQFKTAMVLSNLGKSTTGELCGHLGLEPGSFTSVVDSLVRRGLIERHRNPDDRRQVLLSLSSEGKSLVEGEQQKLKIHMEERLNLLGGAERQRFCAVIEELYELAHILRSRTV